MYLPETEYDTRLYWQLRNGITLPFGVINLAEISTPAGGLSTIPIDLVVRSLTELPARTRHEAVSSANKMMNLLRKVSIFESVSKPNFIMTRNSQRISNSFEEAKTIQSQVVHPLQARLLPATVLKRDRSSTACYETLITPKYSKGGCKIQKLDDVKSDDDSLSLDNDYDEDSDEDDSLFK